MFADRVIEAARRLGPLCVGIDPHPGRIPDLFGGDTPEGLAAWGMAVVDASAGRAAAVKPQAGLFERHGPEGMAALQVVCARARDAGLIVIADAKRGDIGSTAEGYARAWLGSDAPFAADALTLNPYMGTDTLEPYVRAAEENARGIAVLVRTSNPGARDFQLLKVGNRPLYACVVAAMAPIIERLKGETGWSGCMLVAGATGPDEARAIRALAPDALLLVPGYGAQGAGVAEALSGFVAGPAGLEGGLVNASRAVTFPNAAEGVTAYRTWSAAVRAAIESAQGALKAGAT